MRGGKRKVQHHEEAPCQCTRAEVRGMHHPAARPQGTRSNQRSATAEVVSRGGNAPQELEGEET